MITTALYVPGGVGGLLDWIERDARALANLALMGQPVSVVEKPSSNPGVVRFETNRSLTGQGHMRYDSRLDARHHNPADELARRLFDSGRVAGVHVFSNVVTVNLERGYDSLGLIDIVHDLYTYYRPGVVPPSLEELMGDADAASPDGAAAPAAGLTEGGPALSAAAQRVPALLWERSQAALAKWRAAHG